MGQVGFDDIAEFIIENIDSWIGKLVLWDLSRKDFLDVSSEELQVFTN